MKHALFAELDKRVTPRFRLHPPPRLTHGAICSVAVCTRSFSCRSAVQSTAFDPLVFLLSLWSHLAQAAKFTKAWDALYFLKKKFPVTLRTGWLQPMAAVHLMKG